VGGSSGPALRFGWAALLAAALCCAGTAARAQVPVPPLNGRVNDLTGTLSGQAVSRIEAKLANLETTKGAQLAVLVVPTTQPEEIEQFGIRVEDAWKLGRSRVDDGAILIVAKNDRRVRIEVGRGLEGALTDATSNRIVEEVIGPRFKLGDFDGGVVAGIDRMIAVVNGEPLPQPDHKWERHGGNANLFSLLVVVVIVASGALRRALGRLVGAVATGGLAGFCVYVVSHWMPLGIGAGALAFLFALLVGSGPGGWSAGRGWGGRGWGGFGGGGFGGGGGGGGFSGGGGSGAGGGASGSW
jgi:uncharacterized protein